ncbi:MAG: LacI family DNA-binding transcriptional regulator, partial [Proteobacteria bacterium]|nr:LacI family DNA-binding transcriptional regulator [Pseudomonadota bacterium]
LKYRPNIIARSLTTNQSKLIGLAITHLDNQFYPEVVEKLHERLAIAGYRLVLFITRGETDLEPMLDELLGFRLDGIILASSSMAAHVANECQNARVPVVMFNNVDPEGRTPGVCTDNVAGAQLVANFLLAAGHRRLGLVTGLTESSSSIERCAAFAEAITACPGADLRVENGEYTFQGAARATRALLSAPNPPDALFCVNDHMAFAALQTAREMGFEPGRNLSVAGFDNTPIAHWPAFSLTTYAQPLGTMIDAAVTTILAQIEGRAYNPSTRRIEGQLIVRSSTRWPIGVRVEPNGDGRWRQLGK